MSKNLSVSLLVCFVTLSINLSLRAQVEFRKGYYIDLDDKRVDGLIKDQDWKDNPEAFIYKFKADSDPQKMDINRVNEFGFEDGPKFLAVTVKIDRTSDLVNDLTLGRNPTFQIERLFLKVLVEGKASLYGYSGENLVRFFYSVNGIPIEQLVYKRYRLPGTVKIAVNKAYQQQIKNHISCEDIKSNQIESLTYSEQALGKYFLKYNTCNGDPSSASAILSPERKEIFNLRFTPGINLSRLQVRDYLGYSYSFDTDFGNKPSLRVGLEVEAVLPYNRNKWSLVIEPTFQYYHSEVMKEQDVGNIVAKYSFVDFPAGLRYYSFLKNQRQLFFNALYISNFSVNFSSSAITYPTRPYDKKLEISTRNSFAVGAGMKFTKKFSVELRYYFDRKIIGDYLSWDSTFTRLTLIAGYRFFTSAKD